MSTQNTVVLAALLASAFFVLVGCTSRSNAPDIQATVAAGVQATLTARDSVPNTREPTPTSVPTPTPTLRPAQIIINAPNELNLSIQDFPVGWQVNSSDFTPDNAHKVILVKAQAGLFSTVVSGLVVSTVWVYPSSLQAQTVLTEKRSEYSQTRAIGDPKIGDGSWMFSDANGYEVRFRVANTVAQVQMSSPIYGGSMEETIQWARRLESKIRSNRRMGSTLERPSGAVLGQTPASVPSSTPIPVPTNTPTPLPAGAPTPTPTGIPTLAATPTPTPVPTPTPTPTLIPLLTARPTATATPDPLLDLWLVFSSSVDDSNTEIFVNSARGTNLKRLTYTEGNEWAPVWSPDGKRIAFISTRDGRQDLYVMNFDGSEQTRITFEGINERASWSSDSSAFAYAKTEGTIYINYIDGSGPSRLTANTSYEWCPAWSPDGTRIAFFISVGSKTQIYVINSDGLAQTSLNVESNGADCPVWSPDGKWIAFVKDFNIYVTHTDGTSLTRISQGAGAFNSPSWSPDGKFIAYNCYGTCISTFEGSLVKQLSSVSSPSWSPDINFIAVSSGGGLWVIRPGGSTVVHIGEKVGSFSWSPLVHNA